MSTARKILVVDADPVAREAHKQALASKGYAAVTASSGEDAIWELESGKYDAVFTDIEMRGMSGLEVAELMHVNQPELPVVIITGQSTAAAQERATSAGVAAFMQKPLSPEQLADVAARVLRTAASDVALQRQTPVAETAPAQATGKPLQQVRNIVLFLLAPFIGLVYILSFPIVGIGMLAILILRADAQKPEQAAQPDSTPTDRLRVVKTIARMIIAAVAGIAYAVVTPILGIGVLIWFSIKAWGRLLAKAIGSSPSGA